MNNEEMISCFKLVGGLMAILFITVATFAVLGIALENVAPRSNCVATNSATQN